MAITSDQRKNLDTTGLLSTKNLSIEEFLALPETKPASEYIEGQIYQKPMPQDNIVLFKQKLLPQLI